MAIRKIKKSWWIDIRSDYKRYRIRSPENTKAGAEAYEALLRQKLARGELIGRTEPVEKGLTFEEFSLKWFDTYVIPNNKHQEQRMKRYILNSSLIPFFGKILIGEITTQHIEQYKAHTLKKGISPKTVNNRLACLGKCIRTAYEWEEAKGTPPKVVLLKCPPTQTNYLSPDECTLLLSSAEGTIRDVILLALNTGMRQGELRGLQWSSINWENQTIAVRHSLNDRAKRLESPKSNRERYIPMDSYVYGTLFKRKEASGHVFLNEYGDPFDSQCLIRRLNEVRRKAGLRKFTWHTLRHTFATLLSSKSAPLNAVQVLLGHSSISTTMRYAHVAPSTLRSVIGLLNPASPLEEGFGQPVVNAQKTTTEHETKKAYPAL